MGSLGPREVPKPWRETPLIESAALSKAAGCRIFLKLENLQPSGSFKSRALGNLIRHAILTHPPSAPLHFYSSSGGNAGLACVTAAHSLGYPSTVVVPTSTLPMMVSKIRLAGATQVLQVGDSWVEADTHLRENVLANDANGVYVPPFDHPDLWEGASTIVDEVVAQIDGPPDAMICSVGGGGLFTGLMLGLERNGLSDVRVLAMETRGAESLRAALTAGKVVTLDKITSMATSLGAKRVAERALAEAQRKNVTSVVLSDAEAAMGSWRFADDERMLVEASCGLGLAMCYGGRLGRVVKGLGRQSRVVIVVCGGSVVTVDMLKEWREKYAYIEKMATQDEGVPSTVTAPKEMAEEVQDGVRL